MVFGGKDEALSGKTVGAVAAFKRLERAVRDGQVSAKVKDKKHLPLSLLKGLVGEGYLRVERLELKPHQKRQELKAVPDPRLVGTAYRLTPKGRALLSGVPTPQMNRSGAPAPQGPICRNSVPEPASRLAWGCRGAVDPGKCRAHSPR